MSDDKQPPQQPPPYRRPMALVDHFAARALVGLLSGPKGSATPDQVAQQAFDMGHAMRRERARRIEASRQGRRDTDPAPAPESEDRQVG